MVPVARVWVVTGHGPVIFVRYASIPVMSPVKVILDIRIYEVHREDCQPASGYLGYVFHQPKSSAYTSNRIARKLREHGFTLGGRADHLYIDLDADSEPGEIEVEALPDNRVKRVRYGLDRVVFNALSDADREAMLATATFAALRHVTDNDQLKDAIDSVESALAENGSTLEITHKTKCTKSYTVDVTFQIRPNGGGSVAFVTHTNNKTGERVRSEPFKLFRHSDIYLLCGTVTVKDRRVVLTPYKSIEGQVVAKPYDTPIEFPIDAMHDA
ncbi:MAG: hypothetical protein NXI04_22705 [Planctomycetaceae bacterium]|nr:hypothetical protein [Planctomycetaceae bacterium]